jgi:hypothetical protein
MNPDLLSGKRVYVPAEYCSEIKMFAGMYMILKRSAQNKIQEYNSGVKTINNTDIYTYMKQIPRNNFEVGIAVVSSLTRL